MINIAEILKDCPKRTKLYSPIFGEGWLSEVGDYLIKVYDNNANDYNFYHDGSYVKTGECMLFPSKDNRDWNTFRRPFQDGDIISNNSYIAIFHKLGKPQFCEYDKVIYYHCWCYQNGKDFKFKKDFGIGRDTEYKFATEDEKRKLFIIIKENGYKWNAETKTLEKLIVPKFKADDKIVKKDNPTECWYVQGVDTNCNSDYFYYIVTKGELANLQFKDQDDWELAPIPKFKVGDIVGTKRNKLFDYKIIKITDTHYTLESIPGKNTYDVLICEDENWKLIPNKFDISTLKAYDKVLVRDCNDLIWVNALFGFYDTSNEKYPFVASVSKWAQCIPYEGNQHLLGTTNDCDKFYKNW